MERNLVFLMDVSMFLDDLCEKSRQKKSFELDCKSGLFAPHRESVIIMAANLIPFLLTMYIVLAIISAIGKDLIVEMVTFHPFHFNCRHGIYTSSFQSQFGPTFPPKSPCKLNSFRRL